MDLLTIEEFAERMRVSVPTARHWRVTGYGPASRRIGRRVVYLAADVDQFIAEQFAGADTAAS